MMNSTLNTMELKEIKNEAIEIMEGINHPVSADELKDNITSLKDFFGSTTVKVSKSDDPKDYIKLKTDFWKIVVNKLISLIDKYMPKDFEEYYSKLETGRGIAEAIECLPDEYKNKPMLEILKSSQQQELWQLVIDQYKEIRKKFFERDRDYAQIVGQFSEEMRDREKVIVNEIARREKEDQRIIAFVTKEMKKALDITKIVITRLGKDVLVSYYYNNEGAQSKISMPDITAGLLKIQPDAKFDYIDLIRINNKDAGPA
jgi:hypothetical protein